MASESSSGSQKSMKSRGARIVGQVDLEGASVAVFSGELAPADGHRLDLAVIDVLEQVGIGELARRRALRRALEQVEQRDQQQADHDPERKVPEIGIHVCLDASILCGPASGEWPTLVVSLT